MARESPQTSADEEAFPRLAASPHHAQPDGAPPPALAPFLRVEECLRRMAVEEAHSRTSFLARAEAALGQSLDLAATARGAAPMTVPAVAELTILVQPAGTDGEWSIMQVVDLGHAVALDEFRGANRLPAHLSGAIDRALAHATQTHLPASSLVPPQGGPDTIAFPLRGRGQTFGVLIFSHGPSGRPISPGDHQVAEEKAARAASAIDNARHYREIEEADQRKTETLSVLAHELRNPLAAIRYAVDVLRLCGKDEEAVRSAQDVIDDQVTHMVRLVDDLSDVSRLANGKVRLELEPLDLAAVVREAAEASRPSIEARKHRLTVRVPQGPLHVNADHVRLSQVLTNLLNNAAKYTPPGGAISLSLEREADEAVLRVCDNGVGIPAETLPKIFDMFMQVDGSRGLSQGGLGIGLTLVRRFVEMHGGSVRAASGGSNCGSEFTVRLPLAAGSFVQP